MKNIIEIRTHHLLCIPRFYHGGYDEEFTKNMKKICQRIRKNPDIKIKVVIGKLDDLCSKCPHKHGKGCIQSKGVGKWVIIQDKRAAKYLNLKPNSVHVAKDIFNLSMEKVNPQTISKVCEDCINLENCIKVGINNSFRKDLNKKQKSVYKN